MVVVLLAKLEINFRYCIRERVNQDTVYLQNGTYTTSSNENLLWAGNAPFCLYSLYSQSYNNHS